MANFEYLSRSRLPQFTPRLDLTAEDLNSEAEVLVKAINELAGRIFIIKNMTPEDERSTYSDEVSYPILDELTRLAAYTLELKDLIDTNKDLCDQRLQEVTTYMQDLETRFIALDDEAARKVDLEALNKRVTILINEIANVKQVSDDAYNISMDIATAFGIYTDTYISTTNYNVDDIVVYGKKFWKCKVACIGEIPSATSTYWEFMPIIN